MADDLTPARFGEVFKAFMEAMVREATPVEDTLGERIRAHLGGDVATLPVVTEEFDPYEHPNVQVALDELFAAPERGPAGRRCGAATALHPFRSGRDHWAGRDPGHASDPRGSG
jgi:hypothetical protein